MSALKEHKARVWNLENEPADEELKGIAVQRELTRVKKDVEGLDRERAASKND